MLRTRLWMGAVLIALAVGMLVVDQHLMPWAPFLFVFVAGLGCVAAVEMGMLLRASNRRLLDPTFGVLVIAVANWIPHVVGTSLDVWLCICGTFAALVVVAFLDGMGRFWYDPDNMIDRLGRTVLVTAYLGLLPSFFAQLRWLGGANPDVGTTALALAIFVPKMCDSGAYFTGRLLGRHKMTPVLSPKKTWEGTTGGLVTAVLTTIAINRLGPAQVLGECWGVELAFGLSVGIAGILGDLAESLVKRDCQQKDASQAMPGFGGVLDVVDAVIFAGPVVYAWMICFGG